MARDKQSVILPDIDHPNQLFGHKPQSESI